MSNPNYIKGHSHFTLLNGQADRPVKKHPNHPCLELVLTERTENRYEDIALDINEFKTGLTINPPDGYHYEVVADPKLYRHGYFLVNSPIVLDPNMTGEIIVPLYKFKENDDLSLPFTACQLVLRKNINHHVSKKVDRSHNSFFPQNFGSGSSLISESSGNIYTPDFMGTNLRQGQHQNQPVHPKTNHMF